MNSIDITNSGPIEGTFSIDLSNGPGVYEFRGARGSGKTTCISSIDWLSGHKVDITIHDNEPSGRVEGFGVVAPIGGRKRRKGTCDVDTIDAEKFSLTDVLDPPGKTPEVRDATRIKAIAVLSGIEASEDDYYELAGGHDQFVDLGVAPTKDPVALATRIKGAFDKRAREHEKVAIAEGKRSTELGHVPDDVDIDQESDLDVLGKLRDAARDKHQQLKRDREDGIEKEQKVTRAQDRLTAIENEFDGPSHEVAEEALAKCVDAGTEARTLVDRLERELAEAKGAVEDAKRDYRIAEATLESVNNHSKLMAELTAIASEDVDYPEQEEVNEAAEAVDNATAAYEQGVRIRDVKRNLDHAKTHKAAEVAARKATDETRCIASQVFGVLAQTLKTQHMEIRSVDGAPRLFVEHPKRGRCAFDQVNGLSDGERVDYALRELMPHIESPGMLAIPQRVWQDLQPSDRASLHTLAVERGLYIFGAQVDDGELRVAFLDSEWVAA